MYIFIATICGILIIAGLVGTVIPLLPGIPLVYGGLLIFAVTSDFQQISPFLVILFGGLTLVGAILDWFGGAIGAKKFGASAWGVIGAFIGLIIGLVFFGPIGLVIGPILGVFILEIFSGKALKAAIKAGTGTLVLYLITSIYNFALGIIMTIFFIRALF